MATQPLQIRATKRLGGMTDILATASKLGFELSVRDTEADNPGPDFSQPFIRLLKEISSIQRVLAKLTVEVETSQLEAETAHLTRVSELQKKSKRLAEATAALQAIMRNKERLIARLQQPYSVDSVPVETAFQAEFEALLQHAASDCTALKRTVEDVRWLQAFEVEPGSWQEHLQTVPAALASCTRYAEALSSMREAMTRLHETESRTNQ